MKHGGDHKDPNPADRENPGTKRHLSVDRNGLPLAMLTTAANVHDSRAMVREGARPYRSSLT